VSGEDVLLSWEQRAEVWGRLRPPARPSPGDVEQYEAALRAEVASGRRAACLILGATPELRSLAHRCGCDVVCADADRSMFETLRSMVQPAGPEEFLRTDWFELPGARRFDVVLGDGSVNMVPVGRHGELLGVLARVTRGGGAAVLRVHLRTAPTFASFEEILAWYRREHGDQPFFPTVRTPLYMLWMERRGTDTIDTGEIHRYLDSLRAGGVLTQEEFSSKAPTGLVLHLPRAEAFECLASRWFAIERVRHGADYGFPDSHPIYVLRRAAGG
jgi:hypothetical protein